MAQLPDFFLKAPMSSALHERIERLNFINGTTREVGHANLRLAPGAQELQAHVRVQ
jgi:hypothetical protein